MITELQNQVDLAEVVRGAGVEFQRGRGFCPFCTGETPALQIYGDRFHCFRCGAHGDAIDFARRIHGTDFKGALRHLGIDSHRPTAKARREIRQRRQAREITKTFEKWINAAIDQLREKINHAYQTAATWATVDDFEAGAEILAPLARLEYYQKTLINGSDAEKIEVFERWQKRGKTF